MARWLSLLFIVQSVGCGGDNDEASSAGGSGGASSAGGSGGALNDGASGGPSGGGPAADASLDANGSGDPQGLSFFVTSRGSGADGGNYGGLDGADAFCGELASAAGEGMRTWRAYLCTSTVNARDRIGDGPWYNSSGAQVASDVETLHADGIANGDPQHILDETGVAVPSAEHDIVTGCLADGTVAAMLTCQDWTSSSVQDMAQVGHSEIPQPPFDTLTQWNSVHTSAGCDEQGLAERLGSGRIYCFAAD